MKPWGNKEESTVVTVLLHSIRTSRPDKNSSNNENPHTFERQIRIMTVENVSNNESVKQCNELTHGAHSSCL